MLLIIKRRVILKKSIFLLFLLPFISLSQPIEDIRKNFTVKNWTTENGLPQNSINNIYQSDDGYIWILTFAGISKFDGIKFTNINSSNTPGIAADRLIKVIPINKSDFLILEENGKILTYENKKFQTFNSAKEFISGWLEKKYSAVISVIREYAVFFTDLGIKIIKKPTNISLDLDNNLFRYAQATPDGKIWVRKDNILYYILESDPLSVCRLFDKSDIHSELFRDNRSNYWVAEYKGNGTELFKYEEKVSASVMSKNAIKIKYNFNWVTLNDENEVIIGTLYNGIVKISNGKEYILSDNDKLNKTNVHSMMVDKEKNLWAGTNSDGLYCLKKKRVFSLTTENGLSYPVILSIHQNPKGGIWICTNGGGLNYLYNGKISGYSKKLNIYSVFLYTALTDYEDNLWVGTELNTVHKYSKGKDEVYKPLDQLVNQFTKVLYEDSKKRMWIGAQTGLACYDNGKFTKYTVNDGLVNNSVLSVLEDKDNSIWIGTSGGISHLKDDKFTNFTMKDGLKNEAIRSIYQDENKTMWFGSYGGGLYRLMDGKFKLISSENGLYDDVVHNIIEDKNHRFWMSCNKGIFFTSKKELYDFTEGRISHINCVSIRKSDGMKNDECNGGFQPSACLTKDNKIYYPTIDGIAIIDLDNFNINNFPPQVILEKITIDDRLCDNDKNIEIAPKDRYLEINYTGLSYFAPDKIKFKYKMENFDADWIDAGTRRTAYYNNISPGEYKFIVIACNGDGVWNETGASIVIIKHPPFWVTWWFLTLSGFFILISIFAIYKLRVRQIEFQKNKLANLVEKKTNDLRRTVEDLKESENNLRDSEKQLKESNSSKDLLFSIIAHDLKGPAFHLMSLLKCIVENPEQFTQDELREYLIDSKNASLNNYSMLENLLSWARAQQGRIDFKPQRADLRLQIDRSIDMLISISKRKSINLYSDIPDKIYAFFDKNMLTIILRNLIMNALKFSEKNGEIKVSAQIQDNFIEIGVKDSGIGISEEEKVKILNNTGFYSTAGTGGEKGTGLGLIICKRFIEVNGGVLRIDSQKGKGSAFYFTLPIEPKT
jgi:ligand-binding sensor domain-containing protein/signal transduction histidine kinase